MTETAPKTEQKPEAEQHPEERVFYSQNQLYVVLKAFGAALGASGVSTDNIRRLKSEIREKYGKDLPMGVPVLL